MYKQCHNPEIVIPEGYDVVRKIAGDEKMLAIAAYDQQADETVFLKARNPLRDKLAVSKIVNEANIRGSLSHPQIPAYRTANTDASSPYIVTELRNHDPTVIKRFREFGDPKLAAEVGASALGVIGYIHEQGVIHRDVKPANLLLSWEGADLTDFDISKYIDDPAGGILGEQDGPVKTTIGTLEYMSPEQCAADMSVDTRSDIYSMGQVLLHFLSGKRPSDPLSRIEAINHHGPTEYDPAAHWGREVPMALVDIADRALQLLPEDRYQSAAEMAEDLEYWLHPAETLALAA